MLCSWSHAGTLKHYCLLCCRERYSAVDHLTNALKTLAKSETKNNGSTMPLTYQVYNVDKQRKIITIYL